MAWDMGAVHCNTETTVNILLSLYNIYYFMHILGYIISCQSFTSWV